MDKTIRETLDKSWDDVGADRYNEDRVMKGCKKCDVRRCDRAFYNWQRPTENHHRAHLPNLQQYYCHISVLWTKLIKVSKHSEYCRLQWTPFQD